MSHSLVFFSHALPFFHTLLWRLRQDAGYEVGAAADQSSNSAAAAATQDSAAIAAAAAGGVTASAPAHPLLPLILAGCIVAARGSSSSRCFPGSSLRLCSTFDSSFTQELLLLSLLPFLNLSQVCHCRSHCLQGRWRQIRLVG